MHCHLLSEPLPLSSPPVGCRSRPALPSPLPSRQPGIPHHGTMIKHPPSQHHCNIITLHLESCMARGKQWPGARNNLRNIGFPPIQICVRCIISLLHTLYQRCRIEGMGNAPIEGSKVQTCPHTQDPATTACTSNKQHTVHAHNDGHNRKPGPDCCRSASPAITLSYGKEVGSTQHNEASATGGPPYPRYYIATQHVRPHQLIHNQGAIITTNTLRRTHAILVPKIASDAK